MPKALPFDRTYFNSGLAMCDTSFIGNLVGVNSNPAICQECQETLGSMVVKKTMAAVSVKTAEELHGMYLRNAFRGVFSSGDFNQGDIKDLRTRDPALYAKTVADAAAAAEEALQLILNHKPFRNELFPLSAETYRLAYQLQLKYQFPGFADALQLASAIEAKADYFLTTDKDFCNVNEPNIQVCVDRKTHEKNL